MYSLRNKKKISQSSQILFLSQVDPVLASQTNQTSQTTTSPPDVEIRRAERKRATVPDSQSEKKIAKRQLEKRSFNQSSKGKSNSLNSQKRSSSTISQFQPTNKKEKEKDTNTYPELLKRLENIQHTEDNIYKNFTARELQILLKPHYQNVPDLKRKNRCVSMLLQLIYQHVIDCKQDDCIPSPITLPVIMAVMHTT